MAAGNWQFHHQDNIQKVINFVRAAYNHYQRSTPQEIIKNNIE